MSQPYQIGNAPDVLDDRLLNSLVEMDESIRRGGTNASFLDVLCLNSSNALTAAALCLLELEIAFPRNAPAMSRSASSDFPSHVGRFAIEGILGSGGFGIVYKGLDPQLKRTVAVKIPKNHAFATPELRKRFMREAFAAAKLDHPHIVPIYEAGEAGDVPYIAYAYCDGPTLARWCMSQDALLPSRAAAELLLPVVEATAYSHARGILHRDIKPANVMLFPKSGMDTGGLPFVPKLSDLGLAKFMEPSVEETTTSVLMGTSSYMSPEQSQ